MIASLAALLLGSAALASALPAFERETLASALIQPRTPSSTQLAPTLYTRQNTTLQAVPVASAGGALNPQAAAAANVRDGTATRAFSATTLKAANGQCLFIDPLAGDFRQNLIPVQLKTCDGSANEKFDIITAGKHNNAANSMLVVSSLTQGCLNFDPRRAAGDQVILFSCGGRADGEGLVTDSQLFAFTAGKSSLQLAPENAKGATCLVPAGAKLGSAACSSDAGQLFSIA